MTSHKCGGESVVKKCIKPLSVSHGIIDPVLENIVEIPTVIVVHPLLYPIHLFGVLTGQNKLCETVLRAAVL